MPNIPSTTADRPIWLKVGTVLDGTSRSPLKDVNIVYSGSGIRFVGAGGQTPPRDLLRAGQDRPDADASDCTLLPGLIEAHAHLFLEGGELDLDKRAAYIKQTPEDLLAAARVRLARLVRIGISGVRDAGDKDGVGLALSRLCKSIDRPLMPYVESPGAGIHHKGRYGTFMGDPLENYASAADCVRARVEAGADRIKLIPTGIINFKKGLVTTEPQMTTDEILELVAAAKSFGKQTFAHASGDVGIDRVIDGGVDSVEHGFFMRDDQLARMRDRRRPGFPPSPPFRSRSTMPTGWDGTPRSSQTCAGSSSATERASSRRTRWGC